MTARSDIVKRFSLIELKPEVLVNSEFKYYSSHGKLTIPNVCDDLVFSADDLIDEGEIGKGAYGFVNRMVHRPTQTVMAVKRIRSTLNEREQKNTLKDLDVVMHSAKCPHIVRFYGALFKEGDCWICMEMMSTSLDNFYKFVYHHLYSRIPEPILGKILIATVLALDYLKTELKVIHRDVKPSNILIDRSGNIKLCDFGISGQLIDSIARSRDAGCKPYMAPERIHPHLSVNGYDIRSDVWSLGITLIELATGQFPYPTRNSVFEQLTCVLNDASPNLPEHLPSTLKQTTNISMSMDATAAIDNDVTFSTDASDQHSQNSDQTTDFSDEFRDFVSQCLKKDVKSRPKYQALMQHPFFLQSLNAVTDVGKYFQSVLDRVPPTMNVNELCTTE